MLCDVRRPNVKIFILPGSVDLLGFSWKSKNTEYDFTLHMIGISLTKGLVGMLEDGDAGYHYMHHLRNPFPFTHHCRASQREVRGVVGFQRLFPPSRSVAEENTQNVEGSVDRQSFSGTDSNQFAGIGGAKFCRFPLLGPGCCGIK